MATVAVQREKLYEQVWSIPVSQLSIMYGISDVGLAKVCKRYQIPRPPRGYWARKAVGQTVKQIPLPKVERGMSVVELKGWNMNDQSIQNLVKTKGGVAETVLRDVLEASPPHSLVWNCQRKRDPVEGMNARAKGGHRSGRVRVGRQWRLPLREADKDADGGTLRTDSAQVLH